MSERIYRDSVHNIIRVQTDTPDGGLIARLIDSAEFQRLRRIRQLGLANFAYQAAEHSRFTHSLGAFHLATRILERLRSKYTVTDEQHIAVLAAALLHDVGHGAFSHVIEPVLHFHHEKFTVETVLSDATECGQILATFSSSLADDVADIIRGTFLPTALAQLVSSQLDVDRMDYLLRDSLMTGAKYGVYDLEWIIKSIEIDQSDDRIYVSAKGVSAVEDYLQARHYMFRQVYFHRTLRAAESVLHSLLRRALFLFKNGEPIWYPPGTALETILRGETLTLSEHLSLDESDFVFAIKQWSLAPDAILADLCTRFINRRLFKAFDMDMPEADCESFVHDARKLVENRGFDPEYYFVEDKAGDVEHYFYPKAAEDSKNLIYVEDGFSRPRIREISEVSAAVRGLQKGYRIHRVAFPTELVDEMSKLYHR
ncbi:MAG TPA: HD domain-containing protein [Pyrinomonadaceae bacterium]|nr:HD domain-containing protein [Pyrinomonadaceae bacterium]